MTYDSSAAYSSPAAYNSAASAGSGSSIIVTLPAGVKMSAEILQEVFRQCNFCNPCNDGSGSGGSGGGSGGSGGDGPPINCSGLMVPRTIYVEVSGYPAINNYAGGSGTGDFVVNPPNGMPSNFVDSPDPDWRLNQIRNQTYTLKYSDTIGAWHLDGLYFDATCPPSGDYRYAITVTEPGAGPPDTTDRYEFRAFMSVDCPAAAVPGPHGGVPRYIGLKIGTLGETYLNALDPLGPSPVCEPFAIDSSPLVAKAVGQKYEEWDEPTQARVVAVVGGTFRSDVAAFAMYATSGAGNEYLWNDIDTASGTPTGATVRIYW